MSFRGPLISLLQLCLLVLFANAQSSSSNQSVADIHVDPVNGNDANDGRTQPVKTIKRGIRLAQPGDTVHLATALYHESADLSGKKGEVGKPITLDGHGSVLDGSESVRTADWEALGNGLYRKVKLMPGMDNKGNRDAVIMRWFFLWNGKMNHMGRTSKGPKPPLKKPADLQPDQWTYVQDEDAFYVRIAPEKSLDSANIRYPARSSGVIESGGAQHIIVRNTISTHVYNDGYNIHGSERDCVFENIASIECGDDGFSAHEDAECRIDGFVSIANSTGLCDTVSSSTHYKNLFIKDCLGFDVFFIGDSPHSIENGLVISSASSACSISQQTARSENGVSAARFKNVLFRRVGGSQEVRVSRKAKLTAENCTFINLKIQLTPGGAMEAHQCFFTGNPKPELVLGADTQWHSDHNVYDFKSLKEDQAVFTEKTFADFQKLTGGDQSSRWSEPTPDPKDAGADEAALKPLEKKAEEILDQFRRLESGN